MQLDIREVIVAFAILWFTIGLFAGIMINEFEHRKTTSDVINCTSLCIQQFENATKNVYVSEQLRNEFAKYCFKSCGGR